MISLNVVRQREGGSTVAGPDADDPAGAAATGVF
jgi:hypothetical protein